MAASMRLLIIFLSLTLGHFPFIGSGKFITGSVRFIVGGQILFEEGDDLLGLRICGQVIVLERIDGVVIELLGSVGFTSIPGVAIAAIGEGMVLELIGGQGRDIPLHGRILE
jgi:hypothetical protein